MRISCLQICGIIINFIISLISLGTLILGVLLFVKPEIFKDPLLTWHNIDVVGDAIKIYVTILGGTGFFLSFFGIAAHCVDSFYLRVLHFGVSLSILLLVVAITAIGCILANPMNSLIIKQVGESWKAYYRDPPITVLVDGFQTRFKCCGFFQKGDPFQPKLPASCCAPTEKTCTPANIYSTPCIIPLTRVLDLTEKVILGLLITTASFIGLHMMYLARRAVPRFFIGMKK